MAYGVSVTYGLYGCYGGGRVCFDAFCVGFVVAIGFGALLGDTSILYVYIHI